MDPEVGKFNQISQAMIKTVERLAALHIDDPSKITRMIARDPVLSSSDSLTACRSLAGRVSRAIEDQKIDPSMAIKLANEVGTGLFHLRSEEWNKLGQQQTAMADYSCAFNDLAIKVLEVSTGTHHITDATKCVTGLLKSLNHLVRTANEMRLDQADFPSRD